ncbi:MAG: GNAT family N-acetyltransferase [candidate division WOR-3 bacterium]|nr:MAG: GNAT family N-acetyltransferase [candidate division WOR-3 bacterium]
MKSEHVWLPNIILRELRIEDYDALIELWTEAKLLHRPKGRDRRDNIERELQQPSAVFLVAEKDGKLVGSIFGTHDGRRGWINRLAVSPSYRRQGIAAQLVKEVEKRLDAMGIEIIACLVEDWNSVSMEVFQRIGYKRHSDVVYFSKRKHSDV